MKVTPETHNKIIAFYNSDLVSWQMPGKKDYVVVNKNGIEERIQTKVLLTTVREAHGIFKSENQVKVGKPTFASLRPDHVLPISERDQTVCCCIYHENFDLLCDGLRRIQPIPTRQSLLDMVVCESENVRCNLGQCKSCSDIDTILTEKVFDHILDDDTPCSFLQWTDRVKK